MKRLLFLFLLCGIIITLAPSCHKDSNKSPTLTFEWDTQYLANDTNLYLFQNGGYADTIQVSVTCKKSEAKDKLDHFSMAQALDPGSKKPLKKSMYVEYLSGGSVDEYHKIFTIIPRSITGREIYYFTVYDKDGVMNSDSVIITVLP